MGGSTTLTSIYFVEWGRESCHALYPSGRFAKGSVLGVIARNKGREKIIDEDDSTAAYYAYVSQFKKWAGLAIVNDWKFCRIANINSTLGGTGSFDENVLIQALNHGKFKKGATRMYCNAYVKTQIDIRAKDKGNVNWSKENVFGKETQTFLKIPIRELDDTIIGIAEDAVTA